MTLRKAMALLLACAMLLSLAACGGTPVSTEPPSDPTTQATAEPTMEPTTAPTTAPTEPAPDPAALYADAVTKLNEASRFIITTEIQRTLTINGESYVEAAEQSISYDGYGTEAFTAAMEETADIDGYITTYDEIFADGTMYTTVDDTHHFKGAMTADEYIARFVPVQMLDAALYGEITLEAQDNDATTVLFSAPAAGESWTVPEYAKLVDASGSASLDADGNLVAAEYDVTYAIGGAKITLNYYAKIDTQTEPIIGTPADLDFVELEYVDAPRLLEQAAGYLLQSYDGHSVSSTLAESIISYAAGCIRNQSSTINTWGTGDDYMADIDVSMYMVAGGEEYSYDQVEHFQDGDYTITVDDGEATGNATVTAEMVKEYCTNTLVSNILALDMISGATATDLGSLYYLELDASDDLGENFNQSICNILWGDGEFLNDLASAYETTTMDIYLAIDKFTGLPTAMGYYYEGYHTIEGEDYLLSLQSDQSFDLVSQSAYESITDEVPVVEVPAQTASPLFYHVTGPDGQEMWLLGTIHIGDARTSHLPQEIYDAFDAADALAVEFNSEAFDDALEADEALSDQVSDCYFFSDGTMTVDHVEEELFDLSEKLMKATGSYHMNAPYLKAYFWSSAIDNFYMRQSYDLSSTQGVDNQLIHRALAAGKTILDVESGLFQIQMLSGFSDALQEQLLYETVYSDPLGYAEGTRELFEMWCAGDEAALIAYLNEDVDTSELTEEELALIEEYNNAMGTDRNDDMLDVAIGYLESGDIVFYAVGLAHLLAEDGLVNTLRDAGYTVELVPYE